VSRRVTGKLQNVGPRPLIEPDKLVTGGLIEAVGEFLGNWTTSRYETQGSQAYSAARTRDTFDPSRTTVLPDGTVFGMRWVPTKAGVALSFTNCANCHVAYLKTDFALPARQLSPAVGPQRPIIVRRARGNHLVPAAIPIRMGNDHSECACIARTVSRGRRRISMRE